MIQKMIQTFQIILPCFFKGDHKGQNGQQCWIKNDFVDNDCKFLG